MRKSLHSHQSEYSVLNILVQLIQNLIDSKNEDVLVCRCEEVTVRKTVPLVLQNSDQLKLRIRYIRRQCKYRMYSLTVKEIITEKISSEEVGNFKISFPIKLITIGQLIEID